MRQHIAFWTSHYTLDPRVIVLGFQAPNVLPKAVRDLEACKSGDVDKTLTAIRGVLCENTDALDRVFDAAKARPLPDSADAAAVEKHLVSLKAIHARHYCPLPQKKRDWRLWVKTFGPFTQIELNKLLTAHPSTTMGEGEFRALAQAAVNAG